LTLGGTPLAKMPTSRNFRIEDETYVYAKRGTWFAAIDATVYQSSERSILQTRSIFNR
jgi:hypothetical protein